MTYTIVGRCPRTGSFGVGITTYGFAVGGLCGAIKTHFGALTTQAFINPTFKAFGLRLLEQGYTARQVVAELSASDPKIDYRQVAVVDRWGGIECWTGTKTRDWHGHVIGKDCVACGNALRDEGVPAAMARAFEGSADQPLAERLMRALEAGQESGGQLGLDGRLPERSAGLLVHEVDEHPTIDIRVDMSPNAVEDLRKLYREYVPYVAFHRLRWFDPASAPPQERFAASLAHNATDRR